MGTITNFSARNPDDYVATFHELICTHLGKNGYNNWLIDILAQAEQAYN